jgi:hypothetical protein
VIVPLSDLIELHYPPGITPIGARCAVQPAAQAVRREVYLTNADPKRHCDRRPGRLI